MFRKNALYLAIVLVVLAGPPFAAAESPAELRGDAEAVERVSLMLDLMGGAELWARSKHLYIEQRGWFAGPSEPATEQAWRSLTSPARHSRIVGRHTDTTHVVGETGGWTRRKGEITEMPGDEHARRSETWQNSSYVMLRQLAIGNPSLHVTFTEPHRVRIFDESGAEISWYDINEYGHWMKWGRGSEPDTRLEYVYGPPRDFGILRFPAWGAATDASWRYEYETVELHFEPIPEHLLKRPD